MSVARSRKSGSANYEAGHYRRERDEARARIRELEAERDADVRAVAALLAADSEDALPTEWVVARTMLRTLFAGRIAELEARDGGEPT